MAWTAWTVQLGVPRQTCRRERLTSQCPWEVVTSYTPGCVWLVKMLNQF